ncbi:MAG: DUF2085 domain-containing protein [Candidatus Poseidoniaceae archaeon]|jgi:uncharacterized membrane protein|nr:DUF2085 domain-containing protein [Candidatus Poseidoniaceae archaeon]
MQRNGLPDRRREKKIGTWVYGISGFILLSMFIVPLYLDEGTVPKLSGKANAFDYATHDSWGNVQDGPQETQFGSVGHNQSEYGTFAWTDLDPYAAFIYAFGDLNCHNKAERSWSINGNQMPMCVRDVGIFFGLALGGYVFSRRGINRWTVRDTFLSMFPDDRVEFIYKNDYRLKSMFALLAICAVPMAIDGFSQMLLTSYESNAFMRLVTGIPFGLFIGAYIGAGFSAKPSGFDMKASKVVLPLGCSFTIVSEEE